jgi:hypothetical protein
LPAIDTLFDDFARTDPSPAVDGEDSFSFMNRVAQPFWGRVRDELDGWSREYPSDAAADLRSRFRSPSPAQHFGAWWELYLHQLSTELGYQVEVHPELTGVTGRPDFRLTRGEEAFYIEAATTFSGIVPDEDRHGERENWIKKAINSVRNPNFFVALDFNRVGTERPSDREITEPLRKWLQGLDPNQVAAEGFAAAPELELRPRDWDFVLRAIAVKPEARGRAGHRLLGMGPSVAGFVNDIDMMGRTLDRKRRKYGKPDEPLVFAILPMSSFIEKEDVEQALLGRVAYQFDPHDFQRGIWVRHRNGFWRRGTAPRNTRVSALITGTNIMPWTVAKVWPRLWRNPWAAHPLQAELQLPEAILSEQGTVTYSERVGAPASLFGLPEDWPGPEQPFEDV